MSNYIYIGKFFHRNGKELNMLEKKIGRTSNLKAREFELNRTKAPIGYTMIAAWKTDGHTEKVEKQLHAILDHNHSYGEWYEDDGDNLTERVADFMSHGDYKKVSLTDEEDADANHARREEERSLGKKEIRKKHFDKLIGQTFSYNLQGNKITIELRSRNKFYCLETDTLYEDDKGPSAAFKKAGRELTDNPEYLGTNAWTIPKNPDNKSMDEVLQEISDQAQAEDQDT